MACGCGAVTVEYCYQPPTKGNAVNDVEAHKVLRDLRDRKLAEIPELEEKQRRENAEYAEDPHPLTARIIEINTEKLVRARLEAEALAIAVAKF